MGFSKKWDCRVGEFWPSWRHPDSIEISKVSEFDVFQSTHVLKAIVCGDDTSASAIAGVVDMDQTRAQLFQAKAVKYQCFFDPAQVVSGDVRQYAQNNVLSIRVFGDG